VDVHHGSPYLVQSIDETAVSDGAVIKIEWGSFHHVSPAGRLDRLCNGTTLEPEAFVPTEPEKQKKQKAESECNGGGDSEGWTTSLRKSSGTTCKDGGGYKKRELDSEK